MNATTALRRRLVARDGMTCHWCGVETLWKNPPHLDLLCTVEHLIPRAAGGTNAESNCVISCHKCNNLRGDAGLTTARLFSSRSHDSARRSPPIGDSRDTSLGRHFVSRYAERKTYAEAIMDLTVVRRA